MRVNQAGSPETLNELRSRVKQMLLSDDVAGARQVLLDALLVHGASADLLCDLAVVEYHDGSVLRSLDLAIDALRLDPEHADALHNRQALLDNLRAAQALSPPIVPTPPPKREPDAVAASPSPLRNYVPKSAIVDPSWFTGFIEPTLADPVSQVATYGQLRSPEFGQWMQTLHGLQGDTSARIASEKANRKYWEWAYICQALERAGAIAAGRRGIGFGVGTEPLAAAFAARGCQILATDMPTGEGSSSEWASTNQHGASLADLRHPAVCPVDIFDASVNFMPLDMNDLSPLGSSSGTYDFLWSSCVVEHLGGYQLTNRFITDSLQLLRVGGVAVHTTELSLVDVVAPIEVPGCTFFTKAWLQRLDGLVSAAGGRLTPFNPCLGTAMEDGVVDYPPFSWRNHCKVVIESGSIMTTSVGLIVTKIR